MTPPVASAVPPRLAAVSAADLLARDIPPRECLFGEERVPTESLGLVVGPPRAGKGYWSLSVGVAVASGVELATGWRPTRSRPVVLVAAEDTARRIRERIEKLRLGYGIAPDDLRHLHLIVRPHPPLRLEHQADADDLLEAVALHEPGLVVVDGLRRVTAADEDSSTAMAAPLHALERLRDVTQAAVLVVHHSTISARSGVYQARGSSVIAATVDYQIAVKRVDQTITLTADYDRDGDGWSAALRLERGEDGAVRYVSVDTADPAARPKRGDDTLHRVWEALSSDVDLSADQIAQRAGLPATTVRSALGRFPEGSVFSRQDGRRTLYRRVEVTIRDDDGRHGVSSPECPEAPSPSAGSPAAADKEKR
jgi:hypothetical protein